MAADPLVAIVGPTASGKTDVAQIVARALGADVLSCDSMQIYRGMDIGTGTLPEEKRLVVHHGLDIVDPGEPYSAALFQMYARTVIDSLEAAGRRCVLCGGTGFYVRAVIDDFDFSTSEQQDTSVRDAYTEKVRLNGAQSVWRELQERDPQSACLIEPNDTKRVVRAFEMLEEGTSYARQHEAFSKIDQVLPCIMVGIRMAPELLNKRIDVRVDKMMRDGLVDEVTSLLNRGLRDAITARQAIGYKEIVAALDGSISMGEATKQIKTATHRYAKRQRTWFRKDDRIHWLDADSSDTEQLAEETLAWVARMEDETND